MVFIKTASVNFTEQDFRNSSVLKRMQDVLDELSVASEAYYGQEKPIMSDKQYDALFDELKELEESTGIIYPDSPTQQVSSGIMLEKLAKVTHERPMLSAAKTKSVDEIIAFANSKDMVVSFKEDGLTIGLTYKNGKLILAATRGDGTVGEDVTQNIKTVKNIPLSIPYKGDLILRGELIISWENFKNLTGDYSTPRNYASGAIRRLDPKELKDNKLELVAFGILKSDKQFFTKKEQLSFLAEQGFDVVPHLQVNGKVQIESAVKQFLPETYENPVDGLIFEFNDLAHGESLGATGHHENRMKALKWADETVVTKFTGVELTPTRTGFVSLVALFEEVLLDNTRVSRATLHNLNYFQSLQLGIGDRIEVYKANMIIPQIDKNLDMTGTYKLPECCPCCGSILEIKNTDTSKKNTDTSKKNTDTSKLLICPNKGCATKLVRMFVHFCSRKCMNIEGVSESILETFCSKGWLKNYIDLYSLDKYKSEIVNLPGFGERSWQKIWAAIQNSKNCSLENFIAALGIENLGRHAAKIIADYFGTYENFLYAIQDDFDFSELKGIGKTVDNNIKEWYQNDDYKYIANLYTVMNFHKKAVKQISSSMFAGKTIVVTGTLKNFTRTEIQEKLETIGAKAGSSVSSKTDFLLAGEAAGSKLAKARELGVTIISEEEFLRNM